MNFVGGSKAAFRVLRFPPPLMAHDHDVGRRRISRRGIGARHSASRKDEDGDQQKKRCHRPRDFQLLTAKPLRRVAFIRPPSVSETRINNQAGDESQNYNACNQDENEQAKNWGCLWRARVEDRSHLLLFGAPSQRQRVRALRATVRLFVFNIRNQQDAIGRLPERSIFQKDCGGASGKANQLPEKWGLQVLDP